MTRISTLGTSPMRTVVTMIVLVFTIPLSIEAQTSGDNWPKFRGLRNGVVPDNPALPETWSRTENVIWNVDVPGQGWSSPIVWGDLIFVTAVISDEPRQEPGRDVIPEPGQEGAPVTSIDGIVTADPLATPYTWTLYAFDFDTGQQRWERVLRSGIPANPKHPKNTYASETPVTDGEYVYVFHGNAGLFAVDFDGRIAWSRDVTVPDAPPGSVTEAVITPGGRVLDADYVMGLGQAASPAMHAGRIFVTADHESRAWFFAAFSTQTGEELWHVHEGKSGESYGWSSPFVWENDQRTEVVVAGNNRVQSFSLDGDLLWQLEGLSLSTTPTPFSADGFLYVTSGFPSQLFRPVYVIRPGAAGDITLGSDETSNDYVVWSQRSAGTYMPSGLVYEDLLYGLYTQGFLTAHDAATGEEVYGRVRIARGTGGFTASPWAYNGKIFTMSEDGDTYVIQAGSDYKLLGINSLEEMANATPAIVRGSVIIRTVSSLWRIGQ